MSLHSMRIHPLATDYQQHQHAHHQIVLGLEGEVQLDIACQPVLINEQRGSLLPKATPHGFKGVGYNRLLVIDISESLLLQNGLAALAVLFEAPRVFAIDNGLAHYISFLCHESTAYDDPGVGLTLPSLTILLDALMARLRPPLSAPPERLDLARLERFVTAHLATPIRVAQMATLFHLSPAHFTALFRRQYQTSPYRYVQRLRMQEAYRLIKTTRLSLDHIAAQTHFADQSALTHAFRRHYATTPRQLRRSSLSATSNSQCNIGLH